MKKSDLKTGMFIKLRDGAWHVVLNDLMDDMQSRCAKLNIFASASMANYNEDMTHSSTERLDIVTIANPLCTSDILSLIRSDSTGWDKKMPANLQVIWTRNTDKEQKLSDTIDKLQKQLDEAKQELKNIKEGK